MTKSQLVLDKAIDRVRKLLALAKGTSEHEAALAAENATKLIEQFQLTEAMIRVDEPETEPEPIEKAARLEPDLPEYSGQDGKRRKRIAWLHKNPSFRSRTQLFDFMKHIGIPIEPNGTFLAYKGVRNDYKDAHSGTVDNSPGTHHTMPRNLISDDPNQTCHFGFHVGALGYASTFSQRTVVVRVDPEHVVCVPNDYNGQKMRVCDYTVVGNYLDIQTPMPSTTHQIDVETKEDHEWGGDVEEIDEADDDELDEVDDAEARSAVDDEGLVSVVDRAVEQSTVKPTQVVLTSKPTGPKAATFNRMKPAKLMEQSIDDLRKYAGAHLKIVGASKLPGGKSALVSKILNARRRRR